MDFQDALGTILRLLPSLTHLVLRIETPDQPLTGVDPVDDHLEASTARLLDDLGYQHVFGELAQHLPALRFLGVYVHGHRPRFWRGREGVSVDEGEEILRAEGVEWREVSRVASPKEPKDMAAVFA